MGSKILKNSHRIALLASVTFGVGTVMVGATPASAQSVCTNNTVPCTAPVAYFGGYSLTTGTQYYLSDGETIPGGAAHPGSAYWKSSNNSQSTSGDQSLGIAAGPGPASA